MKNNSNLIVRYLKFCISFIFLLTEFIFGWLITCGFAFYTGKILFKTTTNFALLLGPILAGLLVAIYWLMVILTLPKSLRMHK
ncbi:hypothetical protein C1940_17295 (plasmid) [Lactiplantibacillus plantarum subsp. plantarum]|nr:hypothetical protein C1940_17295 [Lactiplantibacillus plantarum subsp. plantarum]